MRPKITVTSIVKNEERWIWYSIMSVIDFVDEILIYDTGSTDSTVKIIEEMKNSKICFKEKGEVNSKRFIELRQEQLNEINSEWFIVLDGDEIYPFDTIQSLVNEIYSANEQLESIAVKFYNCIGDIYHHNPKGNYKILGQTGNLTVRATRKNIPGLHCDGMYKEGTEGYFDSQNTSIQERPGHVKIIDKYYFHMHHLKRSSARLPVMRRNLFGNYPTYSFGLGKSLNKKVIIPEIFYADKPKIVPSVTDRLLKYRSLVNYFNLVCSYSKIKLTETIKKNP